MALPLNIRWFVLDMPLQPPAISTPIINRAIPFLDIFPTSLHDFKITRPAHAWTFLWSLLTKSHCKNFSNEGCLRSRGALFQKKFGLKTVILMNTSRTGEEWT
jgi:hypothetical protein